MKAYVEIVQRREREIDCDVLTHQKVRLLHLYLQRSLLTLNAVEWCRLRRQFDQDCHGWNLVDSSHG